MPKHVPFGQWVSEAKVQMAKEKLNMALVLSFSLESWWKLYEYKVLGKKDPLEVWSKQVDTNPWNLHLLEKEGDGPPSE